MFGRERYHIHVRGHMIIRLVYIGLLSLTISAIYEIIHHQSVICWVGRLRFTFLSWPRDINSWEHDIMSWPRDVILREQHPFPMDTTSYVE